MRGIDRVLAAILLVGAVGGAAGFALRSGSDSSAQAVSLTAPPLQHIDAPGTVLFAHTPAPTRVAVELRRRSRPVLGTAAPPRLQAPIQAAKHAAAAAPEPAPAPVSPPPEPPRALAAIPVVAVAPTPVQPATEGPATEAPATEAKAHGRAHDHVKQHGPSAAPAITETAVVQPLEPEPTPVDPGGPGQGHGLGHMKTRPTPDD